MNRSTYSPECMCGACSSCECENACACDCHLWEALSADTQGPPEYDEEDEATQ